MKMNLNSRNNLPKINSRVCVISVAEFKSIGTHWIALYVHGDNIIYFEISYILTALELNIFQKKFKKS